MATAKKEQTSLLYKNIPLVKRGNIIVYGDMFDNVFVQMEVLGTSSFKGLDLANNVSVSLIENGRTSKKVEKESLFRALDIGAFWLESAKAQ
jgi:hypothetical protein